MKLFSSLAALSLLAGAANAASTGSLFPNTVNLNPSFTNVSATGNVSAGGLITASNLKVTSTTILGGTPGTTGSWPLMIAQTTGDSAHGMRWDQGDGGYTDAFIEAGIWKVMNQTGRGGLAQAQGGNVGVQLCCGYFPITAALEVSGTVSGTQLLPSNASSVCSSPADIGAVVNAPSRKTLGRCEAPGVVRLMQSNTLAISPSAL